MGEGLEIFLEHGADVFMDMWPFLRLEEVVHSLKGWELNLEDQDWEATLTPRKLLKSMHNFLKRGFVFPKGLLDSLAVLERYEEQKNKEISQRSSVLLYKNSQSRELISFE